MRILKIPFLRETFIIGVFGLVVFYFRAPFPDAKDQLHYQALHGTLIWFDTGWWEGERTKSFLWETPNTPRTQAIATRLEQDFPRIKTDAGEIHKRNSPRHEGYIKFTSVEITGQTATVKIDLDYFVRGTCGGTREFHFRWIPLFNRWHWLNPQTTYPDSC